MFQVLSAKLARQVSSKYEAETGYLVLDLRGNIVYRMKREGEARQACERLNNAGR